MYSLENDPSEDGL